LLKAGALTNPSSRGFFVPQVFHQLSLRRIEQGGENAALHEGKGGGEV